MRGRSPTGSSARSPPRATVSSCHSISPRCAERLADGDADLGLIPVGAYAASTEELRIVPGIAIASHGAVRTVLLVGEVPWTEMKEIALDGASRSSAMLLKLL